MIARHQNTNRVGLKRVCETLRLVRLIFSGKLILHGGGRIDHPAGTCLADNWLFITQ